MEDKLYVWDPVDASLTRIDIGTGASDEGSAPMAAAPAPGASSARSASG